MELACAHLECDPGILCGRERAPEVVRMRELTGLVGIERYGVKVTELAAELGKSRGGVSHWYRRGRPGAQRMRTSRLLPRPLIKPPARSLDWDN